MESTLTYALCEHAHVGKCNPSNYCLTSAINSTHEIILCADCQFNIYSLKLTSGSLNTTHSWKGHTSKINELAFLNGEGDLATVFTSVSSDGNIMFWDVRMSEPIKSMNLHHPCYSTALSADYSLIGCDKDAYIM